MASYFKGKGNKNSCSWVLKISWKNIWDGVLFYQSLTLLVSNFTIKRTSSRVYSWVLSEICSSCCFNEAWWLFLIEIFYFFPQELEYIQSFVINVENRNDPPSDIICSGKFSLPEDAKPGTAVGRCEAIDEEIYQYHQYNLTDIFAVTYNQKL